MKQETNPARRVFASCFALLHLPCSETSETLLYKQRKKSAYMTKRKLT